MTWLIPVSKPELSGFDWIGLMLILSSACVVLLVLWAFVHTEHAIARERVRARLGLPPISNDLLDFEIEYRQSLKTGRKHDTD